MKQQNDIQHVITRDGSSTLFAPRYDEHYHSMHGAIQESMHVFIHSGLYAHSKTAGKLSVLEMGFGTGLNALLTCLYKEERDIDYTTLEAYPISEKLIQSLNYVDEIENEYAQSCFYAIHQAAWEVPTTVIPGFQLSKHHIQLQDYKPARTFDVIYFDAFAPNAQPELWTAEIFSKLFMALDPEGVFVTYSAKGDVKRALIAAGFEVEKIPGPPGKREMLRGWAR